MFLFEFIDQMFYSDIEPSDPCAPYWPVEKRDYSYLEGKPIAWVYRDGNKENRKIIRVAVMDYSIGITIQADDGERYACYHGPDSTIGKTYDWYKDGFPWIVASLEKGEFDISKFYKATGQSFHTGNKSIVTTACAFGG